MVAGQKQIMNRLYVVAGLLFLFAGIVVFKLVSIQMVDGDKYRSLNKDRTERVFTIPASRGNLYAGDGSLLATSVIKYNLLWDAMTPSAKTFNENIEELSKGLAKIFNKSEAYFNAKLVKARANQNRYMLVAGKLDYSTYNAVRNLPLFNLGKYKGGLIVEEHLEREHPLDKVAERTIGSITGNGNGPGLEGAYSQYLTGREGKRAKQKIAKGQWKPLGLGNLVDPRDGYDVVSTIDVGVQEVAHHALLKAVEKFKADHGCVVVMEVATGEIKAISNLGVNDKGNYYERLNYAIGEAHEPGSTFKLISMMAALEDRVIDTSSVVDTEGGKVKFYDRTVYDSHRGGYGKISAAKAFEVSSNTAFSKIINANYSKNPKRFMKRLFNMGVNEKLGLDINGEGAPEFPYPGDKNWYGTTLPWMAFGYGIEMTPMQILTFYNAVANNGEMVKPRLLKEVKELDRTILKFEKEVLNSKIASDQTIAALQKMMANTVKRGTARNIYNSDYPMAGKTGTCQTEYWIAPGRYISSFAGYFPADSPKYSCIVVINKPQKKLGYYGNIVAAPVFKEIAESIYRSTPKVDYLSSIEIEDEQQEEKYQKYYDKINSQQMVVPNVKGMPIMDAVSLLENLGLKVRFRGSGKVISQSLKAGLKITENQNITLQLS